MQKLNTIDDVKDLFSASAGSAALGAAIETGLLWLLAEKPLDGAGVAQALQIPGRRCKYWLQFLHSLGILEGGPQGYTTSSLARAAILDTYSMGSWKHLALDERERSAGVHNLALYIREPGSVWGAQGLAEPKDYVQKMQHSLERAREFTRMLYELHQRLGNELTEYLDLASARRLMDVGGGSGVVSMKLLSKYPDLTATVVDIENVCIAGREIAAENSISDRITYHPAEFDRDEFPGGFDVAMLCDVGVFGVQLFRKVWASLNPSGRFVIVWCFSDTEDIAHPSRLDWTFLDSLEDPDFRFPTVTRVREQLLQAGFQPLPGEHTFRNTWTVIQAQK